MASIVDKENIAKAKDLIEKKDFIGAQVILKALLKTRRFNKHEEVQRMLKQVIKGIMWQDRQDSKPENEIIAGNLFEPEIAKGALKKASRHRLWAQQAKEKTWWYKLWAKVRSILPF
tara:strand:- start:6702 stop:7052 length:351 start_codon:yes stop_codon:yes gene_type:complete